MGLRDIQFKHAYDSDEDDVLNDFYILALSGSTRYRRLAGFFSSSALAVAARGIAGLIRNGGRMELIVGAKLRKVDVEAIERGVDARDGVIADMMIKDLDQIESEFVRDHVRALAWMVAKNKLEIKVAIPLSAEAGIVGEIDEGIYHQKVGILSDDSSPPSLISFSGSVNESEMGWRHSIEEFKVFRSWVTEENLYLETDVAKFEKYWNGRAKRAIVMDIPTAVRERFITLAPETIDELRLERHYGPAKKKLWSHQAEAIKAWVKNGYSGIFAMATGTGKTLAALSASGLPGPGMVTVILVPTIPLLEQWAKKDIPLYDTKADIVVCGGTHKWKPVLPLKLAVVRKQKENYAPKRRLYVVATMRTASSKGFLLAWGGISPDNVQLICDEVHHLGAPTYQDCTKIPSTRRLGLSATPDRDWDEEGTQKTVDYIGKTVSTYLIEEAIQDGHLSRFNYFPHFAFLKKDEWEEFEEKTYEIGKEAARINAEAKTPPKDQAVVYKTNKLEKLLRERAIIKKKAKDKIRVVQEILRLIETFPIIIFCEDHEQLDGIKRILKSGGHRFLLYYSSKPGKKMSALQRDKSLEQFRRGNSDFLLAMKCLDEGLDVPKCQGCIIVASANSTRQFIQRRGRVLRGFKGKTAFLHDIIVLPPEAIKGRGSAAEALIKQESTRMCNLVRAAENEWNARETIRHELSPFGMGYMADL
jgi:superfamily II DNA or RNA helicase